MTHIRSLLTTLNFSLLATILIAQQNIDLWQGLIQASGDILNPAKCSWMPFLWVFNCFGNAWLAEPPQRPWYLLSISNKEGQCHPIQRNLPSMAVRLLGVQISANGCYKKELEVLMQCQAQYVDCLNCTPLTPWEAHVIYHQCNLPKVTYPLPTTNMPPEKNYSSQSKVTSLFWTRWGIPNISPHCIVYAPTSIGGLGFIHLGIEQGQQVLQLFHHLCTSSTNGRLYHILINHYQLYLGLPPSPGRYLASTMVSFGLATFHSNILVYNQWKNCPSTPMDPSQVMPQWLIHHGGHMTTSSSCQPTSNQ